MVATTTHYSDSQLHRLLEGRLSHDTQSEAAAHLDVCHKCQTRLDVIAEDGVCLADVQRFLGHRTDSPGGVAFGDGTESATHSSTEQTPTADFLEPSDRASSLGRFGRYEVEQVIGSGGMGVVLKGFDEALNRYSAIKVLAPVLATSAAARQRFSREAKSSAAVVHDHVVPIHTVDEQRGLPYLVMPLIEGESLEQRVATTGSLEVKEILRIGRQVASGLAAAHEQGLVHRDVKPGNILLQNGVERVLITDFGLARAVDDAGVTQSGVIAGTPQYMSPEQARGESFDHRSDLFSLGSMLYFMCTGHSPFRAETTMGVLRRISDQSPRSIREVNPDIPDWLEAVIAKLLAKDPAERFQSAADVSELLGQWLAHLQQPTVDQPPPVVAPPSETAPSIGGRRFGKGRQLAVVVALAAVLFAGLAAVFVKLGETTIRFDIDDPSIAVHFGDETITFDNDGRTIHIRPGDKNAFVVTKDGDESRIVASLFELKKGQQVVLQVSVADDGDVRLTPDDPTAQIDLLIQQALQAQQREGSWADRAARKHDSELMLEMMRAMTETKPKAAIRAEEIRNRVLGVTGLLGEKTSDDPNRDDRNAKSAPDPERRDTDDNQGSADATAGPRVTLRYPKLDRDIQSVSVGNPQEISERVVNLLRYVDPIDQSASELKRRYEHLLTGASVSIEFPSTRGFQSDLGAVFSADRVTVEIDQGGRTTGSLFVDDGHGKRTEYRCPESVHIEIIDDSEAKAKSSMFNPLSPDFGIGAGHYFLQVFGRPPEEMQQIRREMQRLKKAGFESDRIYEILNDSQKTQSTIEALESLRKLADGE